MDLNNLTLLNIASKKMQWLSEKQKVITENVVNSDTPEYKAQTTASFDEYLNNSNSKSVSTYVTNEKHIVGKKGLSSVAVVDDKNAWVSKPNGNTVSLEQQQIEAAEVRESFNFASNLYKKGYSLYRTALGNN